MPVAEPFQSCTSCESLAGKTTAKPWRAWNPRALTLGFTPWLGAVTWRRVWQAEQIPAGCPRVLWHCAPQGLCTCGRMEGPKPEFTMATMVLRVKVGADSCPCPSRPCSAAPVLGALLTLVLPTTPTQGDKPHLKAFS